MITSQRVPKIEVERKLGSTAMRLLEAWWGLRSFHTAETFAKLSTAAKRAGLTPGQIRTAARKLREAGFVRRIGDETKADGRRVVWRRIAGTEDKAPWEKVTHIHVPYPTAVWLRAAPDARGWGGARPGAGRLGPAARAARARVSLDSGGRKPAPGGTAMPARPALQAPQAVLKENDDGGFSFGCEMSPEERQTHTLETQRRARLAQELLPCPSRSELGETPMPWPPLVRKDDPDVYRARLLANAYRGAVEMVFKEKCLPFSRGAVTRSKHFKRLLAAAKVMHELKIPPAAWTTWSMMVWKSYAHAREAAIGRKKLSIPSVQWVFSTKRMEEHLGWFNNEANNYLGGRLLTGPSWSSFARRRSRAVARIVVGDESPDYVVSNEFPEGYKHAIKNARLECDRIMRDRKARAANGEWVWSFI